MQPTARKLAPPEKTPSTTLHTLPPVPLIMTKIFYDANQARQKMTTAISPTLPTNDEKWCAVFVYATDHYSFHPRGYLCQPWCRPEFFFENANTVGRCNLLLSVGAIPKSFSCLDTHKTNGTLQDAARANFAVLTHSMMSSQGRRSYFFGGAACWLWIVCCKRFSRFTSKDGCLAGRLLARK